jgi:hypothetical protein
MSEIDLEDLSRILTGVLQQRSREMSFEDVLAAIRESRPAEESTDVKRALWHLVGNGVIEVTPEWRLHLRSVA